MEYGCRAIMMNFGSVYNTEHMKFYKQQFANAGKAFILKPKPLRRTKNIRKGTQKAKPPPQSYSTTVCHVYTRCVWYYKRPWTYSYV